MVFEVEVYFPDLRLLQVDRYDLVFIVQGCNYLMVIGQYDEIYILWLECCYGFALLVYMNNFVGLGIFILDKDDKGVVEGGLQLHYFPCLFELWEGMRLLFQHK